MSAVGVRDEDVWRWAGSYLLLQQDEYRLQIWTDLGGALPIYLAKNAAGTAWCSSARALSLLVDAKPDPRWLAAYLLAPDEPVLRHCHSAFTGVDVVPAAHRLYLVPGERPCLRATWRPQPITSGGHALARKLAGALRGGVAARVLPASRPSTDLSGGLDSTAVALAAAEALVGHHRRLIAVTVHPAGVNRGGDLDYVHAVTTARPDLVHRFVPLDAEHAPYSDLNQVLPVDEPAPSTIPIAMLTAQLRLLSELGSDVHLTGDGGDSLLSPPLCYLTDLLRSLRWRRAILDCFGWARLRCTTPWPLLRQAIRTGRTTRADAFQRQASILAPGSGLGAGHATTGPAWATITARTAAADMFSAAARRSTTQSAAEYAAQLSWEAIVDVGRSAAADAQLAARYRIRLHNPFTDSAVIAAALSAPGWQRGGPTAYKPLLADAMADLLPSVVADRRTKGDSTSDHIRGLRANLPQVLQLADGHLAAAGLIDPGQFRALLTHAAAGLPVSAAAVEPAVATEVWLRSLTIAPDIRWETTEVEQISARGTLC